MTAREWLAETVHRYQSQPLIEATKTSAIKFYTGANRRTFDRFVGDVWWHRKDWDILVVLDAARVDMARETLDEPVDSVWSPASTSIDWIERHFDDQHREHWENAAYVTGNPFADHDTDSAKSADLDDKQLGYFDPVYKHAWQKEPVGTTPPRAITNAAINAWQSSDVDRMIVHYMQPHQPFRSRPEWEHVYSNLENLTTSVNQGGPDIWQRIRNGELNANEVWDAYKDNLWWVWGNVHNELLPTIEGRALITADHGNGMGEWGSWGHHGGDMNPHVRKVPVMGPYRSGLPVHDDGKTNGHYDNTEDVASQLEALGYR